MQAKQKINDEIEKTLKLLDQPETLPPDAFFYTRLLAQLDARRQQRTFFAAVLKPALLVALVAVNIGTAFWYVNGSEQTTTSRQELVELLADEFNVNAAQSSEFTIE